MYSLTYDTSEYQLREIVFCHLKYKVLSPVTILLLQYGLYRGVFNFKHCGHYVRMA